MVLALTYLQSNWVSLLISGRYGLQMQLLGFYIPLNPNTTIAVQKVCKDLLNATLAKSELLETARSRALRDHPLGPLKSAIAVRILPMVSRCEATLIRFCADSRPRNIFR